MDILMSSVYVEKNIVVNDKVPSILMGLCSEASKYTEDVEPRFHIIEDCGEDDKYKYYEVIDGEIIKRNNIDPTLTADGLPTVETQLKKLEDLEIEKLELSDEDILKKHNKEILQRIRCIALDAMGKNILSDPKNLKPREKREFIKRIEELYILSEDEIKIMFGNICHDTIFLNGTDYSKFIVSE